MLACAALVGCSDEDITAGNEKQNQNVKLMDAYISLTINPNTDSSPSTGKGYGDEDGSEESSGHTAASVKTENKVNSLLVIATPSDETLTVNPTVNNAPTVNGFVKYLRTNDFENTDGVITMKAKERVDYQIEYKVLAVVNPVAGLLTTLGYTESTNSFTIS